MHEFLTPLSTRAAAVTHSAGHCNALVENPFAEADGASDES